jgi:hypothetical protein
MLKNILYISTACLTKVVLVIVCLSININSNCGGNSAALSVCRNFVIDMSSDIDGNYIGYDNISMEKLAEARKITAYHWIKGMTYKILKFKASREPKEIVIICNKMYSNVPKPSVYNLFIGSPRHAVGYSDGSIGLITDKEYLCQSMEKFCDVNPW